MITPRNLRLALKLISFSFVFFALCAFETSFWPFVIDFLPPPQLWLILIVFVSLKWPPVQAIFYIYFLGFIMTRFSYIPLKMAWISLLLLYSFIWLFKNRINSFSLFSSSVLTAAASFVYAMIYIVLSYYIEDKPTSIMFFHRVLEIGLNFLVSVPLFRLFNFAESFFTVPGDWGPQSDQEGIEL